MLHFERIGIEWQESAMNVHQAIKSFNRSCELCSKRGYYLDCDCCAIKAAHEQKVDILRFLDEERIAKAYAAEKARVKQNSPCRVRTDRPSQKPYRRPCEEPVIPHPVCLTIIV